jgi:small subunit ribosomal protein S24e
MYAQIVDIIHPNRANVSKADLQELLAKKYKTEAKTIVLFGFETAFGGGRSTGFCLIYDTIEDLTKFEPKYRQARAGIIPKKETSRKQIKEAKNRALKIRGTGRRIAKHKAKKAQK